MFIKRGKKGQLSIFIIIAIVIVVFGIVLILLLNSSIFQQDKRLSIEDSEISHIKQYLESKFFETTVDSLYIVSLRGGYNEFKEPILEYQGYLIKLYNGTFFPSKKDVEIEMADYIEKNFKDKLNLTGFEEQGFEFEIGEPEVVLSIGKYIKSRINIPILIKKQDKSIILNSFEKEVYFNLDYLYSIVYETYQDVKDGIDLTKEYNYTNTNITILTLNKEDYVVIIEMSNNLTNMPIYWMYAVTHDWGDLFDFPEMDNIPEFNITKEQEFKYQVIATGNNLTYYDDSYFFDINETTGLIGFNVTKELDGDYNILIRVLDINGMEDSKFMKMNINITN